MLRVFVDRNCKRFLSASVSKSLKERLGELIPLKREEIKRIKAEHGEKLLGNVTIDMVNTISNLLQTF